MKSGLFEQILQGCSAYSPDVRVIEISVQLKYGEGLGVWSNVGSVQYLIPRVLDDESRFAEIMTPDRRP